MVNFGVMVTTTEWMEQSKKAEHGSLDGNYHVVYVWGKDLILHRSFEYIEDAEDCANYLQGGPGVLDRPTEEEAV